MMKMSHPIEKLICTAIKGRRKLTFDYHGRHRIVAPYCFGISAKGSEVLRALQVGGSSSSGGYGFGKLWSLDDMSNVQLSEQTFTPNDPNYNPNDSAMKQILCRIE